MLNQTLLLNYYDFSFLGVCAKEIRNIDTENVILIITSAFIIQITMLHHKMNTEKVKFVNQS